MFYRFNYEAEFYPALSRLPLHVRMKLDLIGVKISLKNWLAFSFEERTVLCHLPVETAEEKQAFRVYLNFLSQKNRGEPAAITAALSSSLWNAAEVPQPVIQKSESCAPVVTLTEWARWREYERYALYKTAISNSQPEAFEQVLTQLRDGKNHD
jgi:hypothetical protein